MENCPVAVGGGFHNIHHWCDNEGVVKAVARMDPETREIIREHKKTCRHIFFTELEARVEAWRQAGAGTRNIRWGESTCGQAPVPAPAPAPCIV